MLVYDPSTEDTVYGIKRSTIEQFEALSVDDRRECLQFIRKQMQRKAASFGEGKVIDPTFELYKLNADKILKEAMADLAEYRPKVRPNT